MNKYIISVYIWKDVIVKIDLVIFWLVKSLFSLQINLLLWEKFTTTNFTTSKTNKNIKKFANHHYIEMWLLVDHYYDITTTTKKDFWCSDFTYGIKKDHNVKNQKYLFKQTTYGILPMVTKACGALGVLLGSNRLG